MLPNQTLLKASSSTIAGLMPRTLLLVMVSLFSVSHPSFTSSSLQCHSIEFGFGLSYTTFEYSDITIDETFKSDYTAIQETAEPFEEYDGTNSLYDVLATVTATITNNGSVTGSEVAQLVRLHALLYYEYH